MSSYIIKARLFARAFILSAFRGRLAWLPCTLLMALFKYFICKSIDHLHGNHSLLNRTRVRAIAA